MRLKLPRIVKALPLGEYAPEMAEASVQVWVNPPRDMLQQRTEMMLAVQDAQRKTPPDAQALETLGEQMIAWYAELWSQGPEETHINADDIRAMLEAFNDTDPGLWPWLTGRSLEMIIEHRQAEKKR